MPDEQADPIERRSLLRRIINRLEIDRATFFALAVRAWQLFAGAITVVLIGKFFSPAVQGYYYTFAALMALQSFFELGFGIVVTNVASHEWANLRLNDAGEIEGDADSLSRLVSLGRLIFKWYAAAALLFVLAVGFGGAAFLATNPAADIAWQWPWVAVVIAAGLLLWSLPFLSLLEGCHQVAVVNRYRLLQGMAASSAVWIAILAGGGLWAIAAATVARLIVELALLLGRYRRFFRPFLRRVQGETIRWREDVWPMQSRLAVSGVVNYFAFWLFTPVLFQYHSPELAGRMGMSWQLVIVLQMSALAWVQTRVPRFGELIARRDFAELDRVFFRVTAFSFGAVVTGAAALMGLVFALNLLEHPFAERLLPPLPFGMFVAAIVLYHFPQCQAFYLRAHKREPLFVSSVISSLLTGGLVWFLGKQYGAIGAGAAFLGVTVLFVLPVQTWIWQYCRREWHAADSSP